MAMNAAQHKIINSVKTFFCSSVFIRVCVFNVWPKTTLIPVWPRDAKRLDTSARVSDVVNWLVGEFSFIKMGGPWNSFSQFSIFTGEKTKLGQHHSKDE